METKEMTTSKLTLDYVISMKCKMCGLMFENKPYLSSRKYCSIECADKARAIRKRREYDDRKNRAFGILANGGPIVCSLCGCPHTEALTIGHFNGDGKEHRKHEGRGGSKIHLWILQNPKEEVLERVRLECIYCNFYEGINKEYPPVEKRPHWNKSPVDEQGCGFGIMEEKRMIPTWYWASKKRKERRERILGRDNHTCQTCGYSPSLVIIGKRRLLHIHHIDKDQENNSDSNLITLCSSCHSKVHYLEKEIMRRKNE